MRLGSSVGFVVLLWTIACSKGPVSPTEEKKDDAKDAKKDGVKATPASNRQLCQHIRDVESAGMPVAKSAYNDEIREKAISRCVAGLETCFKSNPEDLCNKAIACVAKADGAGDES